MALPAQIPPRGRLGDSLQHEGYKTSILRAFFFQNSCYRSTNSAHLRRVEPQLSKTCLYFSSLLVRTYESRCLKNWLRMLDIRQQRPIKLHTAEVFERERAATPGCYRHSARCNSSRACRVCIVLVHGPTLSIWYMGTFSPETTIIRRRASIHSCRNMLVCAKRYGPTNSVSTDGFGCIYTGEIVMLSSNTPRQDVDSYSRARAK